MYIDTSSSSSPPPPTPYPRDPPVSSLFRFRGSRCPVRYLPPRVSGGGGRYQPDLFVVSGGCGVWEGEAACSALACLVLVLAY